MNSKYTVFALVLLLSLSSPLALATTPAVLAPSAVDTHGPRVSTITFSVISTDGALSGAITGGSAQAAEWTLSVNSYRSLTSACGANCKKGTSLGYTFDGIAFNELRPYINSVHFRRAMEYLTNFAFIQGTVLQGVGGSASPYVLPCASFPGACYSGPIKYSYSLLKAAQELLKAGLVAAIGGNFLCYGSLPGCSLTMPITTLTQVHQITNWYRHQNSGNATGNGYLSSTSFNAVTEDCSSAPSVWLTTGHHPNACIFNPNLYYRSDDPLRSGVALALISAGALIGFSFHSIGIYSGAGGAIYGPAVGAVVSGSTYNPSCTFTDNNGPGVHGSPKLETGCNTAPAFDPTQVNATDPNSVANKWDMYTYGWIATAAYLFQGELFNSQFIGTTVNFGNVYNKTIDHDSDAILYATTSAAGKAAAKLVGRDVTTAIPYLTSFFQNTLWAENIATMVGYANIPTYGPSTVGGIYYSSLNVHPVASAQGGNLLYALHSIADAGGMNPLYNTNWVWQADIWGEIYDSPLATPPAKFATANSFINWYTTNTGSSASLAPWVHAFSGSTGATGSNGWFSMQSCSPCAVPAGQNVSFTFRNNITWTDHTQLTAFDYNYSLYAWDVSLPPSLPDSVTPLSGVLAGPLGLMATHTVMLSGGYSRIDMIINSTSIWNVANTVVVILPQHIFQYINTDLVATGAGAMDVTLPYAQAIPTCNCSSGVAPTWLQWEPNMMIGSGPFYLSTFNSITGAGTLIANVNYARAAWLVNATANSMGLHGTPYAFSKLAQIREFVYNPNGVTTLGVPATSNGYVPITNATGNFYIYKEITKYKIGPQLATGPITCDATGHCSLTIPGTLAKGTYELVVKASYTFLGLPRTWYEATGFNLS